MSVTRRRNLLGVEICATDYAGACDAIRAAAVEHRPFALSALAVHGIMTGVLDPVHRRRLNALDMLVPDGQPVRWGINALYDEGLTDRVCGPKLMLDVCAMAERDGLSIGFYGNKETVLAELQRRLRERYPALRFAASIPSRFRRVDPAEQAEVARTIAASGTDILFVGLGCPRQEVWVYENRDRLDMPILAVGAALDFHAGRTAIAPVWMQQRGLEWVYRLWQEPNRLWRRYLLLNPLYLTLLAAQKLRLWRPPALSGGPVEYQGYA